MQDACWVCCSQTLLTMNAFCVAICEVLIAAVSSRALCSRLRSSCIASGCRVQCSGGAGTGLVAWPAHIQSHATVAHVADLHQFLLSTMALSGCLPQQCLPEAWRSCASPCALHIRSLPGRRPRAS